MTSIQKIIDMDPKAAKRAKEKALGQKTEAEEENPFDILQLLSKGLAGERAAMVRGVLGNAFGKVQDYTMAYMGGTILVDTAVMTLATAGVGSSPK